MTARPEEKVEPEPLPGTQDVSEVTFAQVASVVAILGGLVVGAGWGIAQLAPDEAPLPRDPSFIDSIFANVVVIAAARLILLGGAIVLIFAGLYILLSIAVRMGRGQWLRRARPFETAQEQRLSDAEHFFEDCVGAMNQDDELSRESATVHMRPGPDAEFGEQPPTMT